MKVNKRGFTLIELLAAMVILGLIMVIAVPNVMGILTQSRANAYVEDAKKLMSLAEYKFRGTASITRPSSGRCIIMSLKSLDNSELENAPNNGAYDKDNSYIIIKNTGSATKAKYTYYVTLDEKLDNGSHRGISLKSYDDLYNKDSKELIINKASSLVVRTAKGSTVASPASCSVQEVYAEPV